MIKAFIIDDEQDAITALTIMLEKFCTGVMVCGSASTVQEGSALIEKLDPDVLFLDVEMQGETGFDLLDQGEYEKMVVVFTTAHEQYAIRAIKKGAKDYLLKPIDPDELVQSLEKVKQALELMGKQSAAEPETLLYINTGSLTEVLNKDEVCYIRADGRYSELFCTDNRKLVVCRNIGEYEAELAPAGFFRAHKSVLVNLAHVLRLKKSAENSIEMTNGVQLPISRRKKTELMAIMAKKA